MEYPEFKVCVTCFTFNHSKYITDAMNGFTMQHTDFPFVCCIVDDASTDGEQEVIRKYVSDNFDLSDGSCHFERETDYAFITYAQHKMNKNCYFAVLYLKKNHNSINKPKMPYLSEWLNNCIYEALCEGDDWWIDEHKLQRQIDVLDSHPEVDMCAGGAICIRGDKEVGKIQPSKEERILSTEETILGGGGFLATNSLIQRVSIRHDDYQFWRYFGLDFFYQIHGSLRGGIYFLPECMSAYRVSSEGGWSQRMSKQKEEYFFHKAKVLNTVSMLNDETLFKYDKSIKEMLYKNYLSMFVYGLTNGLFDNDLKKYSTKEKFRLSFRIINKIFA